MVLYLSMPLEGQVLPSNNLAFVLGRPTRSISILQARNTSYVTAQMRRLDLSSIYNKR